MEALKVLIGDCSLFMRVMLTTTLELGGFEVIATCEDSQEVTDKCMELKPRIVLLELAIAEVGDFAAVRVIAHDCPSTAIIIIVPEQLDNTDVIVDVVRAGAKGFMRKPISPEQLKARIGSALRR